MQNRFVAALFMFLLPLSVEAKTLYVDGSSGNDGTTYAANSSSTPWRSIGRAAWGSTNRSAPNVNEAARAGDTVVVRAGTYATAGTGQRYDPAYNPANNGTAGAPIVFQAEGNVTLTFSSGRGPSIGSVDRNYITWRGFTVDESRAIAVPDTGPVVWWSSNGGVMENCTILGAGDIGSADNHPGVRIENSTNITIRNNTISNFRTSINPNNAAGIQVYTSGTLLIENNDISNTGSGIFLKGNTDLTKLGTFTVRYNLIHDISDFGVLVHLAPNTASAPTRIYQNVIRNAAFGVGFLPFDQTWRDPRNAKVVNNTIDGARYGFWSGTMTASAGHVFWNNIIVSSIERAMYYEGDPATFTSDRVSSQHNLFYGFPQFGMVGGSGMTLASWQSGYGQDSQAPASRNVNPNFISGSYRLNSGSPAFSGGIDILDLNNNGSTSDGIAVGAYITGGEVIGRTNGQVVTLNPPAAPTSLRIVQ